MTEGKETNPLSAAVIERLLNTETLEISPQDRDICAYLAASTEMMGQAIETGKLVNFTPDVPDTFSIIATQALIPRLAEVPLNEKARKILADPEETRFEALDLTSYSAEMHYFMDQLQLPYDNPDAVRWSMEYLGDTSPLAQRMATRLTGSEEVGLKKRIAAAAELFPFVKPALVGRVPLVAKEALERDAFLVGIKTDDLFKIIGNTSESFADIDISFGKEGMPYTAIAATVPTGPQTNAFLSRFRRVN